MTLPNTLQSREYDKFVTTEAGDVAIRTTATINIDNSIGVSGKSTVLTLTTSWVALPAMALAGRKTVSIQNQSTTDKDIIINFVNTGSDGWIVGGGSGKTYDIKDTILLYGRSVTGTVKVLIEEMK